MNRRGKQRLSASLMMFSVEVPFLLGVRRVTRKAHEFEANLGHLGKKKRKRKVKLAKLQN